MGRIIETGIKMALKRGGVAHDDPTRGVGHSIYTLYFVKARENSRSRNIDTVANRAGSGFNFHQLGDITAELEEAGPLTTDIVT